MKNYDDIINTEWPLKNSTRVKMPLEQRAKIFLPFSALAGYDDALKKALEEKQGESSRVDICENL